MSGNQKIAVVYRSKYGSAERYAQWIADEVKADLYEGSHVGIKELLQYDTIVYGGSLYAVGILGFSLIIRNYPLLKDKKVVVFTVGASPAYPEAVEEVRNSNFTEEMKERVPHFHLRGGFNYSKLNLIDKAAMFLLRKKIESIKEEDRTPDQKGMLHSYDHPADWTCRKAIQPIVQCIRRSEDERMRENGS